MGQVERGQNVAKPEHVAHVSDTGGVEMGQVEGGQTFAAEEHVAHVGDTGGVEMRQVEGGECFAILEHATHVSDTGSVEIFESFDGGEIIKRSKPPCSGGGTMVYKRGVDDDFLYLLHCPGSSVF